MTWTAPQAARDGTDVVKVGCDDCEVTLYLLCRGAGNPVLTCHGRRMTPRGARTCSEAPVLFADGTSAGRLYTDAGTGLVARCTRGGPGMPSCNGRQLTPAQPAGQSRS
jgi:hypothetical protein